MVHGSYQVFYRIDDTQKVVFIPEFRHGMRLPRVDE